MTEGGRGVPTELLASETRWSSTGDEVWKQRKELAGPCEGAGRVCRGRAGGEGPAGKGSREMQRQQRVSEVLRGCAYGLVCVCFGVCLCRYTSLCVCLCSYSMLYAYVCVYSW